MRTTWDTVRAGDTVRTASGHVRTIVRIEHGPDGLTVWADTPDGPRPARVQPDGTVDVDRPSPSTPVRELSGPGTTLSTVLDSPSACADFLSMLLGLPPGTRITVNLETP